MAIRWLVAGAAAGDALFFHFSGHGGQQVDTHGDEEDGYDETICPLDCDTAGMISDDELFELLARPLPAGCRLTAVLDCCHSGHGMDFPFTLLRDEYTGSFAWNVDPHVRHADADVVLFSGCEDDDCSADASCRHGLPAGAMTSAFLDAMEAHARGVLEAKEAGSNGTRHDAVRHTYPSLLAALQRLLAARGFGQRPQISATHPFGLERPVALDDVPPPGAAPGPVVRVARAPSGAREIGGGLGEWMAAAQAASLAHALTAHDAPLSHAGAMGWLSGLFGSSCGGLGGGHASERGGQYLEAEHATGAPQSSTLIHFRAEDDAESDEYDEQLDGHFDDVDDEFGEFDDFDD